MSKTQVIKCGKCDTVIAARISEYADADWFKDVAKYTKRGHKFSEVETESVTFESPLNSCCKSKKL